MPYTGLYFQKKAVFFLAICIKACIVNAGIILCRETLCLHNRVLRRTSAVHPGKHVTY